MLDNKILIKSLAVSMISISAITAASATDQGEGWAIEVNLVPAPAKPLAPAPQAEGCLR